MGFGVDIGARQLCVHPEILDSEDDNDFEEPSKGNDEGEDTFMRSYSDILNEELNTTTLGKSFVRAKEQTTQQDEETSSNTTAAMDEDFTPVDADVNLVKSFLDSFSSQEGLPGPASNLLGLMGLQLRDANKGK
ncbi:hypothetical protein L484_026772 [Morus notabilis]|uniref:Uncharacterized protein n=1 Tax=Morus notabilis TaxID=981085 RepID=W9T108_9ROSA|nr:hypothetical protein L484_026772 [Morus notabilis]